MKRISYQLAITTDDVNKSTLYLQDKSILCIEDMLEANLIIAKKEAYNGEVIVEDVLDNRPIDEIKIEKIQKSKEDLAVYLQNNPLQWTDGEYYSITQEKQNQLTATLVAAQADQQPPEWNSTGGICKQWSLEDLTALALAIRNKVKALVKYQQIQEVAINNANSQEELNAIIIDYDSVKE